MSLAPKHEQSENPMSSARIKTTFGRALFFFAFCGENELPMIFFSA